MTKIANYLSSSLMNDARELALRDYDITVTAEEFADGTIGYLARTPELRGCKAQGRSIIEAIKSLIDARIDYIYAMLIEFIPVAPPNQESTGNATYQSIGLTVISSSAGINITVPQEKSVTVRIPAVVPHVERYADWDALWVAILNGDVEEFDILGIAPYSMPVCHIRKKDSAWALFLTGNEFPDLRGHNAHSKAKLFALIFYLAKGNITRVKCLAKKVNNG